MTNPLKSPSLFSVPVPVPAEVAAAKLTTTTKRMALLHYDECSNISKTSHHIIDVHRCTSAGAFSHTTTGLD